MPTEPILSAEHLIVSFDGFRVLDDLSLTLARGELRFLIGPNGAGKTTFMDTISGKVRPASGRILFDDGTDLTKLTEDRIVRKGIGRKFQTPSVFGSLSCYQNIEVASGFRNSVFRLITPTPRATRERIDLSLERVGLQARREVPASSLSHGERQWLEIGMLLVQDPKLLLLDEPVAGMTGRERELTGELLHALEGDHTVLVTEHDMDFVRQFSRTVTVLHQGQVLSEGTVDVIQADPIVQEVYTGRSHAPAEVA